jgi:hypothetical protein
MIGAITPLGNRHQEPTTEELIPEIETITKESIARNDSSKPVHWDMYVEAHPSLAGNIRALQQDLQRIDALTATDIRAERLHWYGLISRSKATNTPKYQQQAKEATKQTSQERYRTFGKAAREMRDARHSQRAQMIEQNEKTGVQQFVDSFRKHVENDLEQGFTGRIRNMRNKCVEHLQKNLEEGMPLEPLLELVGKISPEAVEKFLNEWWAKPSLPNKDPKVEYEKTVAAHGKEVAGLRKVTVVEGDKAESGFLDLGTAARHADTVDFLDLNATSPLKDFLQGTSLDELDRNGKL